MYKFQYVLVALFLIIVSCKKEDNATDEQEIEGNFYALTVGNSWDYEYYQRVGDSEEFERLDFLKEVEIIGTSIINGETYFEQRTFITGNETPPPGFGELGESFQKQRDSMGYLIDEEGTIIFSSRNQNDYTISENDWGNVFGKLESATETVTVSAGTFTCANNLIYVVLNSGDIAPGKDNMYFVDELGLIKRSISAVSQELHRGEVRLKSYEITED